MGWQSIRIVGASASVIFILYQKIQKMAKCTFTSFRYWLTRIVPDKVQSRGPYNLWVCFWEL